MCDAGVIPGARRFRPRAIYDFGHVLHELQLNAWVLALRRGTGEAFLTWEGERDFEPPRQTREEAQDVIRRLDDDWSAEGMRDPRERPVRPDAVLEVARDDSECFRVLLIEFDRTRRVDKNLEKFRRYDTFLNWWWHRMPEALDRESPCVVFVCQNEHQRERFMEAADYELTGHQMPPSGSWDRARYVGRRRILFAVEHDAHAGGLDAWRLPTFPPDHPRREPPVQRVRLVSPA